ncbi:expressed unknown protein [Seminavis robusta]|uniref:Uncharacterized protein n=1 Tax=Seminavis robusta TaxID=568900 RepID=A0A9N8DCC5_9STRA|nr:expressed unknown protein [Seminavis robusta]|eukprot:Sro79_g042760.1 n/a (1914) ;mRNA; r:68629-74443
MDMSRASEESDNENESRASTFEAARRKRERSDFIGSLFCKGVPSEADSVASIAYVSTKSSEKKSRTGRFPLKSTDLLNKEKNHISVATPHASSCGFPDTLAALLPSSGRTIKSSSRSDMCDCNGACVSCWDASSSGQVLPFPDKRSPQPDSYSIPVIEDLGVTPKSRARPHKYSISHAMNSPGDPIPTPAPIRKKYSPLIDNIPEAFAPAPQPVAAIHELQEDEGEVFPEPVIEKTNCTPEETISAVQSANEDEFLPDDFVENNAGLVYTEEDLQQKVEEALANREAELEMKFAAEISVMYTEEDLRAKVAEAVAKQEAEWQQMKHASDSQDSEFIKDLQIQLQQQLEEQGAQWNKDLQERLDANKNHYRKKNSVFKTRIAELEDKCQALEKSQEDDRGEHQRQTEKLRNEMSRRQEAHDAERTRLINEIAKQNERISDLTKDKANQDQSITPGFIRDIQLEVRSMQIEKDMWEGREAELKDQVRRLEENTHKLVKTVEDRRYERGMDHRTISELKARVEYLTEEKTTSHSDLASLRKKLSARDSEVTMMEAKFHYAESKQEEIAEKLKEKLSREHKLRAGLQRCIRILSVRPNMDAEATTPFDESDWVDSSLETLLQLVNRLGDQLDHTEQRAKEAELNLRKETDSRVAADLEVGRLSSLLQSRHSEDKGVLESNGTPSDDVSAVSSNSSDTLSDRKPKAVDVQVHVDNQGIEGVTEVAANPSHYETPPRKEKPSKRDEAYPSDGSKGQAATLINNYLNRYTSEVMAQLKHDIEALKKIIRHDDASPNLDPQLCLVGEAWVLPKYAVDELNKLVEDIYEQLKNLQEQHGHPRKIAAAKGELLPYGGTSDLLEQLESQKLALAKKEKEHFDEVRKVQKLTEELTLLKARLDNSMPDEERDDWQRSEPRDGSRSLMDSDSDLQDELENMQSKLEEAEENVNKLMEDVETKMAEKAEIIRALGLSHEKATLLEDRLTQLLSSLRENEAEQVSQLRTELQETLEIHYAESLSDEERQVQELLVMLELKQDNERLTTKIQEQEDAAESMTELLETQVIDLTSKCNNLGETIEKRERKITALTEEASNQQMHQALLEKKIDAVIRHIETVESEQDLQVEPTLTQSESDLSGNGRPVDIQKLERVERHLLYIWDEFTRKKVEELKNQRQLLATMKDNIEKHRNESETTIQDLQAKVAQSERLVEEVRQEGQHTIESLQANVAESEKRIEEQKSEHQLSVQHMESKISELEKELLEKQQEGHHSTEDLQIKISNLEENLEEERHGHQQKINEMQGVISGLETQLEDKVAELGKELEEKQREHQQAIQVFQGKVSTLESSLEERQHESHETARSMQDKVAELEKELEEKRHEHQQAVQELQARILALERSYEEQQHESQQAAHGLQAKVAELEKELEEKRHERQHVGQELQAKILALESSNEEQQHESQQAAQGMQAKVADLEKELEEKRHAHQEAIEELQSKISDLEGTQLTAVTVAHSEKESVKIELADALDAVSKANEESRQAFQSMVEANEKMASLATEKEKLSHKVTSLKTTVESLTRELDLQSESLEELETARAESARLKEELEVSTTESSSKGDTIRELKSQLEANRAECERIEKLLKIRSGNFHEELLKRTAELEEKANATIKSCEAQVRKLRDEHSREIDELLKSLDEVEAEHSESVSVKENSVKEKDAIIAALGAQLAESQTRILSIEQAAKQNLEEARDALLTAQELAEARQVELETLREAYENVLESERIKRENAVEEARTETIQEAEQQFEHFNALYRTMTQNYKSAAAKVTELETELAATQQALEELQQDHATRIASLGSDLAEMKAEHAKADADAARSAKDYFGDLEALRAAERDLQSRLTEAEKNSRSVQDLLATLTKEKEELIAENEELKSVCEEALEAMSTQS